MLFNFTYADARADSKNFSDLVGVFSDSSEHTLNMVAYYETEVFSARAAWNWRSEYMIRETGFYGSRMHDDYGTLDQRRGALHPGGQCPLLAGIRRIELSSPPASRRGCLV